MKGFEMLGWTAEDTVTGFIGVVTGACAYVTGCDQVLLTPRVSVTNDFREGKWFDVARVRALANKPMTFDQSRPGGDLPAPRTY
jgi:hypothetical protein